MGYTTAAMPQPTPEDKADPRFTAIKDAMAGWQIEAPAYAAGARPVGDGHVKAILDAVKAAKP